MKRTGEAIGAVIFLLLIAGGVFCLVMGFISVGQSIHDSGVCEGRGGTYIAGKCYANPKEMP